VLLCAALFVQLHSMFGWSSAFLVQGTYCSLLLLIAVIDLEHRIVPNVLVGTGMVLALCFSMVYGTVGLASVFWGALVGGGIFVLLALARRNALGMGDVKLAALIGMMTGFPYVLQALTLGIVLGGLAAALALLTRLRTGKQYIPYAPYLVAGSLMTLLHGPAIAGWYGRLIGVGG
jgi:leader peptidase (prepilin peptidase)/N-methyltransferase